MIPPVFRHIGIPTDQVRTAAPFGQEFQLPFVQHTVFVQISSRYRIGIDSVFEITLADCIDQIGSPLFDKVTIRLNPDYYTGKEFVIETTGNTPENYYIGSLELDGKPLQSVQLPFAEVVGGGTLRVNLAAEPNTQLNK